MWLTCGFACRQTCDTVEFYPFEFSFKLKKVSFNGDSVHSDKRVNDIKNKIFNTIVAVNLRAFYEIRRPVAKRLTFRISSPI